MNRRIFLANAANAIAGLFAFGIFFRRRRRVVNRRRAVRYRVSYRRRTVVRSPGGS